MRDKTVDIMTAIGIVFVVMGHNYQSDWLFFPAYTFHMPLFFFISGYLFKVRTNWGEKLAFYRKKTLTQLLPYFAFNGFFWIVTLGLQSQGIFERFRFDAYALFAEPFFSGHHMPFMIPLWFLLQLFVLNVLFQSAYWSSSDRTLHVVTAVVAVAALVTGYFGLKHPTGFELLVVRTGMCAAFFQLGIVVSRYREPILNLVSKPFFLIFAWFSVIFISNHFGNIEYSPVWGSFENPLYFVPIVTSSILVLTILGLSQILSRLLSDKSLFLAVGRSSFWIMSFHLVAFFFVNALLCLFGAFDAEKLEDIYFHFDVERLFPVYLAAGIVLPILAGTAIEAIRRSVAKRFLPSWGRTR